MATKALKWRTKPSSSQTEGTNILYVCSNFGNDTTGNGTRQKPYKTIAKANSMITASTTIVCRGYLTGNVVGKVSGNNYYSNLRADYYGAAIYDGEGQNFLSWFGSYTNMILVNCLSEIEANVQGYDYNNKYASLVGVGRAGNALNAYGADNVSGFASPPVLCHNSKLWRGCAGFSYTSGGRVVYASPVRNAPTCGVVVSGSMLSCTYYNAKRFAADLSAGTRERRTKNNNVTQYAFNPTRCLFSNWDVFIDEGQKDTYSQCFFDKDCEFIYADQTLTGHPDMRIRLTNPSADSISITLDETNHICSVAGVATIAAAITALRNAGNITQASNLDATFSSCVFSTTESAATIFQNVETLDFSIKYGSAAMEGVGVYYGALPPTKAISVIYDSENQYASDGHIDCFDNRTKNGCIAIIDGAICVEDTSPVKTGSIYSKILHVNPLEMQFAALYTLFADMYSRDGYLLNQKSRTDDEYVNGDELDETGIYIVRGGVVTYNGVEYANGTAIFVDSVETTYAISCAAGVSVFHVDDPNPMNVVYCRCRSHIYATITKAQTAAGHANWKTGIFYLNNGGSTISYNGRSIVNGESFIIDDPSVGITGVSDDYEIAIMFDDRDVNESSRIVPTTEWIPAQLWGQYFVGKKYGAILHDDEGVALASGNPNAYNESGQREVDGFYSILNQPYTQFAIFVNKV